MADSPLAVVACPMGPNDASTAPPGAIPEADGGAVSKDSGTASPPPGEEDGASADPIAAAPEPPAAPAPEAPPALEAPAAFDAPPVEAQAMALAQ